MLRDPHSGPVPEQAWHADALARERGRVQIFNATRADGLDGWTMDERQYELMRAHILDTIDEHAGDDGTVTLREIVDAAQERFATHPLFPGGRTRNYCVYTKVDLEARCEIDRIPRSSPQRIRRHVHHDDTHGSSHSAVVSGPERRQRGPRPNAGRPRDRRRASGT